MVAKSYQTLKQVSEPFEIKGRMYVNVQTKNGQVKTVRWYSDSEYAKMYPEETPKPFKSQKEILGFEKGYITIFKGDTYGSLEWFQASIARYCKLWGWYIISTESIPFDLPFGLEPIQLVWELVGNNDGSLKDETSVKDAVDSLLYDAGVSEYQGEIGQRLDLEITVVKSFQGESDYGNYFAHTFEDAEGNQYSWITSSKSWAVGSKKHIRGTVKDYKKIHNVKITVLTRCMEVK